MENIKKAYGQLTRKQRENWKRYGKEVYEKIEEVAREHNIDPKEVQEYYTRLKRPKQRGDGMMYRDNIKMSKNPDLHYIKKELEDYLNPMSSMQGLVMATMSVRMDGEEKVEKLEKIARVIAIAMIKNLDDDQQRKLLKQHKHRGQLYGL